MPIVDLPYMCCAGLLSRRGIPVMILIVEHGYRISYACTTVGFVIFHGIAVPTARCGYILLEN